MDERNEVVELPVDHLEMVAGGGLLEDALRAISDAIRSIGSTEVSQPALNADLGIRG